MCSSASSQALVQPPNRFWAPFCACGFPFVVKRTSAMSSETAAASRSKQFSVPPLSLSASVEEFALWSLRFQSFAIQQKSELTPFFAPGADPARVVTKDYESLSRLFSSYIISCVGDDVLVRFRQQIDLHTKGLVLYQRLVALFAEKKGEELCPEEIYLGALSLRLSSSASPTAADTFLREILDVLPVVRRTRETFPFAERLLMHHVLHQFSGRYPWVAVMSPKYVTSLRAEDVRTDGSTPLPADYTLQKLVDEMRSHLRVSVSASPLSSSLRPPQAASQGQGKSALDCTVCGRSGHVAAKCFDRKSGRINAVIGTTSDLSKYAARCSRPGGPGGDWPPLSPGDFYVGHDDSD